MPRYYRRRSRYSYGYSTFVLVVLMALFGMVFRFDTEQIRAASVYLWLCMGVLLVVSIVVIAYAWRKQQQKLKALQMIDVDKMSGKEFEDYLAFLLKNRRFTQVVTTPYQGDFGADLIATRDGKKFAIQAKRQKWPVGVEALYQCFGGQKYYGCDECMVITNSTFTPQAEELAKKSGMVLWDKGILAKEIVSFQDSGR